MSRPQQYLSRVNRKKKERFQSKRQDFIEQQEERKIVQEKIERGETVEEKRKPKRHDQIKTLRYHRAHPTKKPPTQKKAGEGEEEDDDDDDEDDSSEGEEGEGVDANDGTAAPSANPDDSSSSDSDVYDPAPFMAHAARVSEANTKHIKKLEDAEEMRPERLAELIRQSEATAAVRHDSAALLELDSLLGLDANKPVATLNKRIEPLKNMLDNKMVRPGGNSAAPAMSSDLEATLDDLLNL